MALPGSSWPKALDRLPNGIKRMLYATYGRRLQRQIAPATLPKHIAVLADGNRRWARANAPGRPLELGYLAGADKLKEFVRWCSELEIEVVTLWVLSTDNLRRSAADELGPLLKVIVSLVTDLVSTGRYRVMIVGDLKLLPEPIATQLTRSAEATADVVGLHVNVAVSYGGRHELRDAVRSLLAEEAAQGSTLESVAQTLEIDQIADHLYTKGQPDPDLIIRTSGEQRLSGFLMWQSAHSEYYFCEALWPDFRKIDFHRALRSYAHRERRYGT